MVPEFTQHDAWVERANDLRERFHVRVLFDAHFHVLCSLYPGRLLTA